MKWKQISVLFGVFIARMALATDATYLNEDVLQYVIPGAPPPTIDARNFINNNSFSVSFNAYSAHPEFYETWNTINYSNYGAMIANSPVLTNGALFIGLYSIGSFGTGFNFDQQTTNQISRRMAGTFYNSGSIRCDSFQDGNNVFNFGAGFYSFLVTSLGQCKVSATNLINSGTIDVGAGGLIQLAGKNVDLSGGQLTVETNQNSLVLFGSLGSTTIFNFFNTVTFNNIVGTLGVNTNFPWNPFVNLKATRAQSSYSPFPYIISLTNSTAYIDDQVDPFDANTIVHRSVFILNNSPTANVAASVFFDPLDQYSQFGSFYPGCANVCWTGSSIDPATGNSVSNYLYLSDDYIWGATTNRYFYNGVPYNFTFSTSSSQVLFGAAPAGFVNEFSNIALTNAYAYMSGTLSPSSVITNASNVNPSGSITNLPGAVKITASDELNMANATIAGPSYMLLNSPNQFDGSPGASIASPYSDIYLGVTNGFMTASNLLVSGIQNWSGNLQAWSTRWIEVDAVTGITNDFRVMIVSSSLQPVTLPWIQNLYLHGTNSLMISDALNVYGSFYSDARNLTLTTNLVGVGATSLDGELTWNNPAAFNANTASGTQQMPNLLWLTNNGVMRMANTANFGNAANVYGAFINHSLITNQGMSVWTTNFLSDGLVSNGVGSFALQSRIAVMTNGNLVAGGDVSLIASNSLTINHHLIQAGRKLTLQAADLLTDNTATNGNNSATNGNIWVVGSASAGGTDSGFNILVKPSVGDLLGTTVTNISPASKTINNVWAGTNYGLSTKGYSNNVAVGRVIFDALGSASKFNFNGVGTNNALYVDYLELRDFATNTDNNGNVMALSFNTNLVVYYAQAMVNGISVAGKLNHKNGDHLRWLPAYAGYFSSTNLVYPPGVTNVVNMALASSQTIDSDGDGTPNGSDPTPVFLPAQVGATAVLTNLPVLGLNFRWLSVPAATNYILYTTNLNSANWLVLTNFISPTNVPPVSGWPLTNTVFVPLNPEPQKYFRIRLDPNTANLYGP